MEKKIQELFELEKEGKYLENQLDQISDNFIIEEFLNLMVNNEKIIQIKYLCHHFKTDYFDYVDNVNNYKLRFLIDNTSWDNTDENIEVHYSETNDYNIETVNVYKKGTGEFTISRHISNIRLVELYDIIYQNLDDILATLIHKIKQQLIQTNFWTNNNINFIKEFKTKYNIKEN